MKTKMKVQPGQIQTVETVKFTRASRGSVYQPIFDQMAKLRKGQGFEVKGFEDESTRMMMNRINAAIARCRIKPPKGCRFRRGIQDEKILICCVAVEED